MHLEKLEPLSSAGNNRFWLYMDGTTTMADLKTELGTTAAARDLSRSMTVGDQIMLSGSDVAGTNISLSFAKVTAVDKLAGTITLAFVDLLVLP